MGGIYGKLLIIAYSMFATVILGFIIMCIIFGRKGDKTSSTKINKEENS
jgi:hypothetical protein